MALKSSSTLTGSVDFSGFPTISGAQSPAQHGDEAPASPTGLIGRCDEIRYLRFRILSYYIVRIQHI